ncbi:hypothetical protein ABBQ38_009136 [Trebouxia sp. C0009 RCD-2024]
MLVWQDMPSMRCDAQPSPEDKQQFEEEMVRMIENHKSFPCIVQWVVFNEGWGQYETERLTELAKQTDPSRLVCCASGSQDKPVGDIIDMHVYLGPVVLLLWEQQDCSADASASDHSLLRSAAEAYLAWTDIATSHAAQ